MWVIKSFDDFVEKKPVGGDADKIEELLPVVIINPLGGQSCSSHVFSGRVKTRNDNVLEWRPGVGIVPLLPRLNMGGWHSSGLVHGPIID